MEGGIELSDLGNEVNQVSELINVFRLQREESHVIFQGWKSQLEEWAVELEMVYKKQLEEQDSKLQQLIEELDPCGKAKCVAESEHIKNVGTTRLRQSANLGMRTTDEQMSLHETFIHELARPPCSRYKSSHIDMDLDNPWLVLVNNTWFKNLVYVMILLNALSLGWESQYMVEQYSRDPHFSGKGVSVYIENGFVLFFLLELIARIVAYKLEFFRGTDVLFNILDTVLVLQSLLPSNRFQYLRIFRIFRFARILRILRVMKLFHSFRVMIFSLILNLDALFWVLVMLGFVMYMFALLYMFELVDYLRGLQDRRDDSTIEPLMERYGTVCTTMQTLFLAITGGNDWEDLMNPLLVMSSTCKLTFSFYIFFMMFGVLNVVTSVFVDSAYRVSMKDPEIVIRHEMEKDQSYVEDLQQFFSEADTDESGKLSLEEFLAHMQSDEIQAYFNHLELDAGQAETLFTLLDADESGEVQIEELVNGCAQLKGIAKNLDVAVILCKQEALRQYVEEQFKLLRSSVGVPAIPRQQYALSFPGALPH